MKRTIELFVNGDQHRPEVTEDALLLDVLREQVGATEVREGCGVGACGACTVLADGRSVSSCLALAARYDGAEITTSAGLPADDVVVESFVALNALQCGYCTPGFVLMTYELLLENPSPSREQVIGHLVGNICRCGAYQEICDAALLAAEKRVRP